MSGNSVNSLDNAVYDCLVPFDGNSIETSLYKESRYAKVINYWAQN